MIDAFRKGWLLWTNFGKALTQISGTRPEARTKETYAAFSRSFVQYFVQCVMQRRKLMIVPDNHWSYSGRRCLRNPASVSNLPQRSTEVTGNSDKLTVTKKAKDKTRGAAAADPEMNQRPICSLACADHGPGLGNNSYKAGQKYLLPRVSSKQRDIPCHDANARLKAKSSVRLG